MYCLPAGRSPQNRLYPYNLTALGTSQRRISGSLGGDVFLSLQTRIQDSSPKISALHAALGFHMPGKVPGPGPSRENSFRKAVMGEGSRPPSTALVQTGRAEAAQKVLSPESRISHEIRHLPGRPNPCPQGGHKSSGRNRST